MRTFIPNIINLGILFLLIDLKQRGYISMTELVIYMVLAFIVVNALYFYFKKYFVSKKIRKLKSVSHLLEKNPEEYLEKVDEALNSSKEYEEDYLTLHKGNILHKMGRNKEAIEVLNGHLPLFLDDSNKVIYFNNLIGLYLTENDFTNAKKVYDQNKSLLRAFRTDKTRGYSILVNEASIMLHFGDKKNAAINLDKAIKIAPDEKYKEEIYKLKDKFLSE